MVARLASIPGCTASRRNLVRRAGERRSGRDQGRWDRITGWYDCLGEAVCSSRFFREDDISAADVGPAACVVGKTMEQMKDQAVCRRGGVVPGRSADVVIAVVSPAPPGRPSCRRPDGAGRNISL